MTDVDEYSEEALRDPEIREAVEALAPMHLLRLRLIYIRRAGAAVPIRFGKHTAEGTGTGASPPVSKTPGE